MVATLASVVCNDNSKTITSSILPTVMVGSKQNLPPPFFTNNKNNKFHCWLLCDNTSPPSSVVSHEFSNSNIEFPPPPPLLPPLRFTTLTTNPTVGRAVVRPETQQQQEYFDVRTRVKAPTPVRSRLFGRYDLFLPFMVDFHLFFFSE